MNASPLFALALFGTFACSNTPEAPAGGQAGQGGQAAAGSSAVSGSGGSNVAPGGAANQAGSGIGGVPSGGASGAGGESAGVAGAAGGGGSPAKPVCPEGAFEVPSPGEPQTVCQGFVFGRDYNEGPTWVAGQGAFFFSNFRQGAQGGDVSGDIIKYTPGGACELFISDVGTNGLAVANNGNLLGASHKTRSITEWNITTKQPTILADMYMNELFDSPNDLVQSSNGTIYFSNPTYELAGRPAGVGQGIFRRDPAGVITPIKQGGAQPNGITLSPEEDRLYVVNGGIWAVDPAGVPSNPSNIPYGADGLAMDCAGNVYLSGGSIRNPAGDEIGTFSGGTNQAFGGPDGKTLFVVGGGTDVKVIQTNVPGLP